MPGSLPTPPSGGGSLVPNPSTDLGGNPFNNTPLPPRLIPTLVDRPTASPDTNLDGDRTLYGTQQDDTLSGGSGDDVLFGYQGQDSLFGGQGNDLLRGGKGFDFLNGGKGDDTLLGDRGWDILVGGEGSDLFVLQPAKTSAGLMNADMILDFQVGIDRIGLTDGVKATDLVLDYIEGHTFIRLAGSNANTYLGIVSGVTPEQLTNSFVSVEFS